LKANWQTGKYEKKTLSVKNGYNRLHYEFFAMDNDFLLFCYRDYDQEDPKKFQMMDLRTMELKPNVIHKLE
jgi:hypothetical protein